MGLTGIDVHKPDRPLRAEMGGLAVLLGIAAGSTVFLVADYAVDGSAVAFAAAFASIALIGIVGAADDLHELDQRTKPLLIVLASVPLMYYLAGRTTIFLPVIGSVQLGLLYPLVAVPLAVTTCANFSNMLAGFNGLEGGVAVISLGTMSLLSQATGHPAMAVLGYIITLAFVGFLAFNWYPARLFPGDTGTLMAGAAVAAIGLVSGLEFAAIILSIPAAMDFALKAMSRNPFKQRRAFGNTTVSADGVLQPPAYPALVHAFMRVSPIKERGLVVSVLAMQLLYAAVAVVVTARFAL
ncbi:MAG TPA: hypothetical protein VEJ36_06280 [Nitrososphaerales archaeon]|nr:hypothetical protein [Nitrososphaerales archaeon]